jgi:hypothetical protein
MPCDTELRLWSSYIPWRFFLLDIYLRFWYTGVSVLARRVHVRDWEGCPMYRTSLWWL